MGALGSDLGTRIASPFHDLDVAALLAEHAARRPDATFLIWSPFDGGGDRWTYRRFADEVAAVAAGLARRGVSAGDRVLIHLDNCPEFLLAWHACARLGAVAVTTNTRSTAAELAYFWEHAEAVGAVTQPRLAGLVDKANPGRAWMLVTDSDNGEPAGSDRPGHDDRFASLYGEERAPLRAPNASAPLSIQYTSGTTSRPKGVLWTHANALWGGRVSAAHEDLRPDDVHLTYLPLYHTNALSYSMLAALWVGATLVVQPRFSASRFWPVSVEHGCTWTSMVPFCRRALAARERPTQHFYRYWGDGACHDAAEDGFGIPVIGWWGMTETVSHGICGSPHRQDPALSLGRPAPEYEIAIVTESGAAVERGQTGDLLIRGIPGLSLFAGYVSDEEATAASFDEQGFFRTGDRVTLLENGCIRFSDRSKDMLKVGGENVAASEVERVILQVTGVLEAAVVGAPDKMLEQVPVAFVIASPEQRPDAVAAAVLDRCRVELADFKVPTEVRLVESLPRSTLEKVAKAELRQLLYDETTSP